VARRRVRRLLVRSRWNPQLGFLHARDITFAMASPAPQANLRRYAGRMGWTEVPWYTISTERVSADFGVDEWFGLNTQPPGAKQLAPPARPRREA
jgi:predicted dithiol-disulfide oxidoreductase (DUF899 family)